MAVSVMIIGAGKLGTFHARKLAAMQNTQAVNIYAVADPSEIARNTLCAEIIRNEASHSNIRHPNPKSVADYREVIGAVQAAVVAAPSSEHFRITQNLLSAGVDVFLEKPMTLKTQEAITLERMVNSSGCILQVGHIERFNPAFCHLLTLGLHIRYVHAVRHSMFMFRSLDTGVVHDLMIHDLELLLALIPGDVISVKAQGVHAFSEHEDAAYVQLVFSTGALVTLEASRTSHSPRREMRLMADDGWYTLDFNRPQLICIKNSMAGSGLYQEQALCNQERSPAPDEDKHTTSAVDTRHRQHNTPRDHTSYDPQNFNGLSLKDYAIKYGDNISGFMQEHMPILTLEFPHTDAIQLEMEEFIRIIHTREKPRVGATEARRAVELACRIKKEMLYT